MTKSILTRREEVVCVLQAIAATALTLVVVFGFIALVFWSL